MKRIKINPRKDYKYVVESLGMNYHTINNEIYWNEGFYYKINNIELEELQKASSSIYVMYENACDYIIKNNLFEEIGIKNLKLQKLIKKSWDRKDFYLYGRFDFSYDGINFPKLLKYNTQTPTSILESSIIQLEWISSQHKDKNQFNNLHKDLIARWGEYKEKVGEEILYFCVYKNVDEDFGNVKYLEFCAKEAGIKTKILDILEVYKTQDGNIIDLDGNIIKHLFHLIPYEYIEESNFEFLENDINFIEPIWKIVMQSKGILKILWKLYPNNKYLLPCYDSCEKLGENYVKKPFFSREGTNISLIKSGKKIETDGNYGKHGHIYQAYNKIPKLDNKYFNIGVWMIGDKVSGMGFREDSTEIIKETRQFIPFIIS